MTSKSEFKRIAIQSGWKSDVLNLKGKAWRGEITDTMKAQMPSEVLELCQQHVNEKAKKWIGRINRYQLIEDRLFEFYRMTRIEGMPSAKIKEKIDEKTGIQYRVEEFQ